MHDVIIIGGGTAGLTAAIYAARAGLQTLILESGVYGGQIIPSPKVENFPGLPGISGAELAQRLYDQATQLGVQLQFEQATGLLPGDVQTVLTETGRWQAAAVILTAGTKNRPLGLENEDRLTGRGISYCATCDGAFYKNKTVAVIGGGNTALDDAETLAAVCKQVYLIHRRNSFRGDAATVRRLQALKNITFMQPYTIAALEGEQTLMSVRLRHMQTNEEQRLPLDGLFVAIGQIPQNQPFSPPVELDDAGYIRAGEDCHTNLPGVFAAGDCRTKSVRQLVTAAADGAVAALAAAEYIRAHAPHARQTKCQPRQ